MSYDDLKRQAGRRPAYFMELFVDRCTRVYGVAPCTASGPADQKCFNTIPTCQDLPNFDRGAAADRKVYRFSSLRLDELQDAGSPFPEGDAPTFPTITGVAFAPTVLTPGKSLGVRATCSVQLTDHVWSDVGVDPYLSERTVDFLSSGTFWGRFLARNLYLENRTMVVHQGYLDDEGKYDPANFLTRTYIINNVSGPDPQGKVTVTGKDPLKFADNERKQWPRISTAELAAGINDVQTSFDITDSAGEVEAAFNQGQPWVRIDDEILEVSNVVNNGGGAYTLTATRGTNPAVYSETTTAEEHDLEATVQVCWYFDDIRVDDLVFFLLNTGAGIDPFFLPLVDWAAFVEEKGLINYTFTRLLVEPIGIKDLLNELCELNILLWWDERAQEVRLDAIVPSQITAGPYNDREHILKDSVTKKQAPKQRISQVWISFGDRNPIRDHDKIETYRRTEIRAAGDEETEEQYGDSRVRRIWSRWMPLNKRSVVGEMASRLLIEYKQTKDIVSLSLDPKDDEQWTGDKILLQSRHGRSDFFGAPALKGYQILEVSENLTTEGTKYSYVMQDAAQISRAGLITPDEDPENPGNPFPDYTPASETLKSQYAFIGYSNPSGGPYQPFDPPQNFPDGTPPYQII